MRPSLAAIMAIALGLALLGVGVARAQISLNTWGEGGIRVGTSITTCDPAAEGAIRYSSVSLRHESCDGVSWDGMGGGGAGASLPSRSVQFNSAGSLGGSADLVFSSASRLGVGTDAPYALLHVDGEAIFGSTSLACGSTTEGGLRWNNTDNTFEMCDGSAWRLMVAALPTVFLVLSPNSNNGMNVDGSCGNATCYGTNVTFTLQNQGVLTSAAITTALTNTTYFEFVSDTCNGATLAASQTCTIVVRPKATGNTSYTGNLQITANNNPLATLGGTSSNFGCVPGRVGGGGVYAACALPGGYDLVVLPGGCSGVTTNPTCSGTDGNPVRMTFGSGSPTGWTASTGPQNTVDLAAYAGGSVSYPAVSYCMDMNYGGKTDWYLPSIGELQTYLYPNRVAIGGFAATNYWSSSPYNTIDYQWIDFSNAFISGSGGWSSILVRCARREVQALPSPVVDTTPNTFSFAATYGTATTQTTSGSVTIQGVTQPVNASISGSGSPEYRIDGGSWQSSGGTVTNGSVVELRATSGAAGTERTITFTAGGTSGQWKLRVSGANTLRAFVTSTTYNCNRSGIGGIDSLCNTRATAAGLGGSWLGLASASGDAASDRIPWNWNRLENMAGAEVATSVTDLFDGSISNAINRNEFGVLLNTNVWTGTTSSGGIATNTCNSWTDASNTFQGQIGLSSSTTSSFIASSIQFSAQTYSFYCIEASPAAAGSDGTPDAFMFNTTYTTAANLVTSDTITVSGINQSVAVTVSGSGSPEFRINGGAWGTSGNVSNGGTVQVRATSGAAGTERVIAVNIGTGSSTWKVRVLGTSSNTLRAFVTSTTYNGARSGIGGVDSLCNTRATAAGLGSTWMGLVSGNGNNAIDRIPWNWDRLDNMAGEQVASSVPDMFDGTLANAINRDEFGVTRNTTVWTGSTSGGLFSTVNGNACSSWNDSGGAIGSNVGTSSSTSGSFFNSSAQVCSNTFSFYCIETATGTAGSDGTPDAFTFNTTYTTASNLVTSNTITVAGINQSVAVTVSGSGSPEFRINGGSWGTSGNVSNGGTVQIRNTSGAAGVEHQISVTIGLTGAVWRVRVPGSNTIRAFVTSTTYDGNIGGGPGADTKCAARATAASLAGTWRGIFLNASGNLPSAITWNWNRLETMNGSMIASSVADLFDGSISNAINRDEFNASASGLVVWTGLNSGGTGDTVAGGANCALYTSNSGAFSGVRGDSGSTSASWINTGTGVVCSTAARIYCIEDAP